MDSKILNTVELSSLIKKYPKIERIMCNLFVWNENLNEDHVILINSKSFIQNSELFIEGLKERKFKCACCDDILVEVKDEVEEIDRMLKEFRKKCKGWYVLLDVDAEDVIGDENYDDMEHFKRMTQMN